MPPRLIPYVYVLALGGATFNHVTDLMTGGWLPYTWAPLWANAFWTALSVLDPLAAALVLWRPRWGAWLTLGIMLLDVPVNLWLALQHRATLEGSGALLAQTLFLGFVVGTAPALAARPPVTGDHPGPPPHDRRGAQRM